MQGKPAIYLGRIVSKENFRTFIYAPNGSQKLVESWDAFEAHMQSGLWFATPQDCKDNVVALIEKPKRATRVKKGVSIINLEPKEDTPIEEDMAFEVKDDFLPKD